MCRPIAQLVQEMILQIEYPLNDEWCDLILEEFDAWLRKEGSSVHSIERFAAQINARIGKAEMNGLLAAKGD